MRTSGRLPRLALPLLLSLALHAALLSVLPRSARVQTPPQEVMRVSLQIQQPPKTPPQAPAPSPRPARTEQPAPKKPTTTQRTPAPRAPAPEPALKPSPVTEMLSPQTPEGGAEEPAATGFPNGTEAPAHESPTAAGGSSQPGVVDLASLTVTKKILPDYPMISRKRKDQGTATLLAVIEDGRVTSVTLERSSGHAPLDEAALRAVREWRFGTSGIEGKITARIPITFSLAQ